MKDICEALAGLTRDDLAAARAELLAALDGMEDPTAAGVMLAEIDQLGVALNRL